ncbi:LPS export ABC transporter periplasmic protein LptC [Limnohabitans sp. 103DPR2]|uniref:LPS export ABC transporter periplasmic protein LptC n=1 Tax=Limnohabitans sp. 103DPR2 TaxID=1678129 RepID=UPI0007066C43|nr:LPS export ABC transporter periplasmic protein LptC [Limnohabitans sp. 103DPR2]ALK90647.1 Lipopolysaccharide-assembly, LptC-related [Limnohabitans sp. 103DPR2]
MMNGIRRLLDRLALYLPAVLMALFALGSWWLVRSLPSLLAEPKAKQVRHEPDYFLSGFSVKSFDSTGRLTRELSGDRAQHFPDIDTLDISQVQMRGQNQEGKRVIARSDRAIAKGDGSLVTFIGNVQFTQPASMKADKPQAAIELRSQEIQAFVKEERLVSHVPVEIRRGQDVFTAERMAMNSKTGEYELSGKVRGVVNPAKR